MMKRILLVFSLLIVSLLVAEESIQELLDTKPTELRPTHDLLLIGTSTVMVLEQNHYSHKQITPSLSAQWFQEYFEALDPMKLYFLQSDIDVFRPKETKLWNREHNIMDLNFAFQVYKRYLERFHERVVYVVENIDKPQDFTVKEYYDEDRKNAEWPASQEEQRELWRKSLKNDLLVLKIEEKLPAEDDKKNSAKKTQTEQEKRDDIKKRMARYYKSRAQLEPIEVLEIFLATLGHLFDPHTAYMAPMTTEDFTIDMQLSLQGIGATLSVEDDYTTIMELVPMGPAEKSGELSKGDRIIAVAQDGQEPVDVIGMPLNKVVRMIRGPANSFVTLTILKENENTPHEVRIKREVVTLTEQQAQTPVLQVKGVDGKMKNIMVIHVSSFYENMTSQIKRKLKEAMNSQKLDGILLDLRSNGGGLLTEAIDICDLFLPKRPVVQISNGTAVEVRYNNNLLHAQFEGPVLVLVDGFSASASEIAAAALQDTGRAIVVGDMMTHGKGTVQSTIDLRPIISQLKINGQSVSRTDSGIVKCTTSKFYRINGDTTQRKGVTPDIVFPSFLDVLESKELFLPHVLSSDTITPASYTKEKTLETYLPALRTHSERRRAANPSFQELKRDIQTYQEITKRLKQVPLEYEERLQLAKQRKEINKRLKAYYEANENMRTASSDEEKKTDYVQKEALNVLLDIIHLTEGPTTPPTKSFWQRLFDN